MLYKFTKKDIAKYLGILIPRVISHLLFSLTVCMTECNLGSQELKMGSAKKPVTMVAVCSFKLAGFNLRNMGVSVFNL